MKMTKYVAEIYDDRDGHVISRGTKWRIYNNAWEEADSLMNDFVDQDDGCIPLHWHKRVVEIKEK